MTAINWQYRLPLQQHWSWLKGLLREKWMWQLD